MANLVYFKTTAGKLKCISICLISTVMATTAVGFLNSKYILHRHEVLAQIGNKKTNAIWGEIYLLGAAIITLACSVVNLVVHLSSREIYWNRRTAIIDFLYHCGAFLILSTGGLLTMVSAVRIIGLNCTTENKCQLFEVKLAAGIMSVFTSIFCGVIATVVLTNRKEVERDGLVAN